MVASMPPTTRPRNRPAMLATLLMPEGEPPLVGREGVGDDGAGVGGDEGAADALDDAHDDEPRGSRLPGHPVDAQEHRADGEDEKAQVVHADPAEHVADAPEADHQHAGHDEVAEHHPQQVEAVARHQRVEPDAPEDGRHGDEDDRRVDRGDEDAHGGVGQDHPLVAVARGDARTRLPAGGPAGLPGGPACGFAAGPPALSLSSGEDLPLRAARAGRAIDQPNVAAGGRWPIHPLGGRRARTADRSTIDSSSSTSCVHPRARGGAA